MSDIANIYTANKDRYDGHMVYNRVGNSGLFFPAVSLGFWHNFGSNGDFDNMRAICRTAFDEGITQFDLAHERGQSLAEMALAWILKDGDVCSVLIGASRPEQIRNNVRAIKNCVFSDEELRKIDVICRRPE